LYHENGLITFTDLMEGGPPMMTGAFANALFLGFRHPFIQLNLLKRQMDAQSDAMFHH
jgi:hypothetical protein